MPPPLFTLSYSKVQAYRTCRKRYWFRYLSGEPRPPEPKNVGGLVGTAVHRGMRVLTETRRAHLGRVEVELYLRMPGNEMAGPGTEGYGRALACYDAGREIAEAIPSAERWAERDLSHRFKSGLEVTARVDRIDRLQSGEWQVIDWKTGVDQDEWTDEQLDLAHVAARQNVPIAKEIEVTAIAWNLREKLRTPGYVPRTRKLRREDAVATMEKFVALAGELQATTDFVAMPGRQCGYCEWRDRCPEADAWEESGWDPEAGEAGDHDTATTA